MELVLIPAVVAFVELLRRAQESDWFAVVTIIGSGTIGVLLGLFGAPGVENAWTGLTSGLAASGVVTIASKLGK